MQVTGIKSGGNYDAFLVDALGLGKSEKSKANESQDMSKSQQAGWQKDILLTALDKLEKNVATEKSGPLNYISAPPIDNFQEALHELSMLVSSNFEEYASKAQANLSPADILYLFEEEQQFVV